MSKKQGRFAVEATVMDDDNGWDELVAEIYAISEVSPGAEVGFPEGQGYEARQPGYRASVLDRATVNEFGNPAKNIPRRPFLRRTFTTYVGDWVKELDAAASKLPTPGGGPQLSQAFARVVEDAVGATKSTIRNWSKPANAPLTIAYKGFNDPLVETGAMEHAVMAKYVYEHRPPTAVPEALNAAPKRAQRRQGYRRSGRGNKSILGALLASSRRWGGMGAETAFRAPGKSASKKATRTRFVPKIKYRRPPV